MTISCRLLSSGIKLTQVGQTAGSLVGEISLEEMWRMVDRIRVGEQGFALVVAQDGQLIAHGNPNEKAARRAR